jgi:hypothetical protein
MRLGQTPLSLGQTTHVTRNNQTPRVQIIRSLQFFIVSMIEEVWLDTLR